ncbi:MAG: dihydrodipicolinate synthase family protein [Candidatus Eremiobacteraeota bacterium]|nr:dihydrodipicolinate synthase family protein [Candidatus Eremiobacteraeota bacterium]
MTSLPPSGILAAIATPVDDRLEPDHEAFLSHARHLLANGCDGLNVLGTTGQATSFSVGQRLRLMAAIASSGLPLEKMMVGTGAANLEDAVRLTQSSVELGFGGALVIPLFYYKNVSEDGVFSFFAELLARVDGELRLYLYNFPGMSAVPFTPALVGRLLDAFPERITGLKDSSQDVAYEAELHRLFPAFEIFAASEAQLLDARRCGYAGCISATLNVTSALSGRVWAGEGGEATKTAQRDLAAIRGAISEFPLVPALHHMLAHACQREGWVRVMPPLRTLTADQERALDARLGQTAYSRGTMVSA